MVKNLQDVLYVESKEALFTLSSTTSSNQYGIKLNSQLQSHWYLQYYLFKFNYETRRPWSVRRFLCSKRSTTIISSRSMESTLALAGEWCSIPIPIALLVWVFVDQCVLAIVESFPPYPVDVNKT